MQVWSGVPTGVPVANKDVVIPVAAAEGGISVDGVLDEAAWDKAPALRDFTLGRSARPAVDTRVLVTHDEENLYVAVINEEPNTDKLITRATERDGRVWSDDSVEIYIDPSNEKAGDYYGFFVSASNVVYDRRRNEAWSGEWRSATRVLPGKAWVVEVAIPFRTLGITFTPGHRLGLMVARNRRAGLAKPQAMYLVPLVPCAEEAKDTTLYPVLELK